MSDPLVTEDWTQRKFVVGKSAIRAFDITGVADFGEALTALNTYGVHEGDSYPIIAGEPIAVPEGGIEFSQNGRMVRATVNYVKAPGGSGLAFTDWKWQCRVTRVFNELPMVSQYDGKPILSSARAPIETNMTKRDPVIVLEMTRFEEGSDLLTKKTAYENRWNSHTIVFPKIGSRGPGEVLLDCIQIADGFSSLSPKLNCLYRFLIKPKITGVTPVAGTGSPITLHGFYVPVPDVGTVAWDGTGYRQIVWGTNHQNAHEPVSMPVRLNGRGVPLDTRFKVVTLSGGNWVYSTPTGITGDSPAPYKFTADGVTLYYDPTLGSANLNDLDIAANV